MAFALTAIFVASKLEDEFLSAADIAAGASDDAAAAKTLAAAIFAAEPILLAGVRFDLRVAHPHRPLAALCDDLAEVLTKEQQHGLKRKGLEGLDNLVCVSKRSISSHPGSPTRRCSRPRPPSPSAPCATRSNRSNCPSLWKRSICG